MAVKKPTKSKSNNTKTTGPGISHPMPSAAIGETPTPTLDELARRLRGAEGAATDEDISNMLHKEWQKIAGVLVVGLLAVWLVQGIRTAWTERAWESADRFMNAQQSFATVVKGKLDAKPAADAPADAAKAEELQKTESGLNQTLNSLSNSSDGAYGEFAKLYEAAGSIVKDHDPANAQKSLVGFDTSRYTAEGTVAARHPIKEVDITGEFAALLYARSLLDGTPDQAKEGKQRLLGLSYSGQFLNGEALLAYARAAASEEERAKSRTAADALRSSRTEALEAASPELSALGIKER